MSDILFLAVIAGIKGLTALHHAAIKNHLGIVKSLIRSNARLDIVCHKKYCGYPEPFTAFRLAAHEGHTQIAILLVEAGHDLHTEGFLKEERYYPEKLKNNVELLSFLHYRRHVAPSMISCCIQVIRKTCGENIFFKVMALELPKALKDHILLKDVLEEPHIPVSFF